MHWLIGYNQNTGDITGMHGTTILSELAEMAAGNEYDGAIIMESDGMPDIRDKVVRNGQLVARDWDITDARRQGIRRLNRITAAKRVVHIPKTRGASHLHSKKETEARRWLDKRPNDLEDYPLMAAEVGLTAADPAQLAELWLTKARETDAALAAIERDRMEAKAAIKRAGSKEAVDAVLAKFEAD